MKTTNKTPYTSVIEKNSKINFYNIFMNSDTGIIVLDADSTIVIFNPWLTKYTQYTETDVIGKQLTDIFPVLKTSAIEKNIQFALRDNKSAFILDELNQIYFPLIDENQAEIHQHINIKPIKSENQDFCLIQITDVSTIINHKNELIAQINENELITTKLAEEKERIQVTLNSIADAVIITDEQGYILSMNAIAVRLIGIEENKAQGQKTDTIFKLVDEKKRTPIPCPVTECLNTQKLIISEDDHILVGAMNAHLSITDSVAPIFNKNKLLGAILVFRSVTRSRALSANLNWQALHDPLTGLVNRRQFETKLDCLLEKAMQNKSTHYLLYLDLDQFKVVNDTCGHPAGDELLKQISATLEEKLRNTDILARLGGDEFAVLLEDCNESHAVLVANKLRQTVEEFRFGWQTQSFKIGVSIGVASIRGDIFKASEILSAADTACYTAKESGRNRVHVHSPNKSSSAARQKEMQWISRLQAALDNNQFELYLQRIQKTSQTTELSNHYEVLIRMIDHDGKLIPPGAFLPAAERFNLIESIDRWVVERVFLKLNHFNQKHPIPNDFMIAINLSGASIINKNFLDRIYELLETSIVPAQKFCFEITETAAITNLIDATAFLTKLRQIGCKVALDDFGSGLSSFAYLKQLPIDFLKIDGHFVKDIDTDNINEAFVRSIHQIGQVMGLKTIAEFVENDAIFDLLKEIGVDYAQGYGIHKPEPFNQALTT